MFGLFSLDNNCFVRLIDLSSSRVHEALQYSVIGFCEREGAEAAKDCVRTITGLKEFEVRKLG